ncbi:MAG: fatty acid desaturase [Planctomycetes bacterium]|nr:fatty acid desaturase [Planctomycetota bacterium]
MKSRYYATASKELKTELKAETDQDVIRLLHSNQPWRHFFMLARQYVLLALGTWVSLTYDQPWLWIPAAILVGFTIFNFTVFLHEVVHEAVFAKRSRLGTKILGAMYAFPSGISHAQFHRWHMDHHDNLGSDVDDPKRHYLSPKRHKRWFKLLYCTPALFPIYFRAAAQENRSYPEDVQKQIAVQRTITVLLHLSILAILIVTLGAWTAFKIYMVPYFFVFPVAFTLNRLGQHYYIDPQQVAAWSTLMKANRFWDFMFCYSNYHLEHHYFPRVPFYNLRKLHFALKPFFDKRGMKGATYSRILWDWYVLNKTPHTNWDLAAQSTDDATPRTAAARS